MGKGCVLYAINLRVFHKSLSVAVTGPALRKKNAFPSRSARACPSPRYRARVCSRGTGPRATVDAACAHHLVGQARQILPCSGSGEPELQRWARCLFEIWRSQTTEVGLMPSGTRLPSKARHISIIPPFGGRNAFRNNVMKPPQLIWC